MTQSIYTKKQEVENFFSDTWFCFYHNRGFTILPYINISRNTFNLILSLIFIISTVGAIVLHNKKSKEIDKKKIKSYDNFIYFMYTLIALTFLIVFGQYVSCLF